MNAWNSVEGDFDSRNPARSPGSRSRSTGPRLRAITTEIKAIRQAIEERRAAAAKGKR